MWSRQQSIEWARFRRAAALDPDAAERSRLLAAHAIANDSKARARVEAQFGLEASRAMYPEAYRGGFGRLLDKVRDAIPWG